MTYSSTTFGQIIKRKHMKRILKAYFKLYLVQLTSTILFENGLIFDNKKCTELKVVLWDFNFILRLSKVTKWWIFYDPYFSYWSIKLFKISKPTQ